ncbi:MAG: hypothetical protein ACRC28_06365 [Clostridium sp.]|uniref:hypothetical protein n=1 Tax=Clostridium sp. TaxID=1506 RepID=UPI003F3541D3
MKLSSLFKKKTSFKFALVSFSLSFIFFLLGLGALNSTSYRLSNYSPELKKLYNIDDTTLSFDYWFASGYYSYDNFVDLSTTQINTLDIIAPNTKIYIGTSLDSPEFLYYYSVVKNHSLASVDTLSYKYFNNTKSANLTLNDSIQGIYYPELHLNFPSSFKGKVKIHGFKDNIIANHSSNLNLEIIQPKEKK